MLREKETVLRKVMIGIDGLVVSVSFVMAYLARQGIREAYSVNLLPNVNVMVQGPIASMSDYLVVIFFVVPLWCMVLYFNGMYGSMRTRTFSEILRIIVKSAFLSALVFGAFVFLFKLRFISRLIFIFFMFFSSIALLLEKFVVFSVMHYVRKQGYNFRRLIVVGIGERAVNVITKIKDHPEWGLRIEAVLDYDKDLVGKEVSGFTVKGTLDELETILRDTAVDEVIFIVPRDSLSKIQHALYTCETHGVKSSVAVDLFSLSIAKAGQSDFDGLPVLTFSATPGEEWQLFIKRLMDVVVSAASLVVLSPFLLFVAAMIKITSPGPVLFRRKRVGLNGRTFIMFKFRTMMKGAHQRRGEFQDLNMMKGPVFKIKDDPRVTAVGKVLRKFSIDELPQLVNVLIGHMSLVGPRPPLHSEVIQYKSWQRRRLSMRPGLTCLWQISGRNRVDFDNWMKLDMAYIDNWSLWLDIKIILKTFPVVFFGIGAY